MEELASALQTGQPEPLRQAAKDWAGHSLENYDAELLGKALAISQAIANFLNEMERK